MHWPLEKQSSYKISFRNVLIFLAFLWCWRSWDADGASFWYSCWSHSLAAVNSNTGSEQSMKVCASLHLSSQLCTKSAIRRLEQVVKELGKSEAKRSIFILCCELVSKLSLWIPLTPSFASVTLKILARPLGPWPHIDWWPRGRHCHALVTFRALIWSSGKFPSFKIVAMFQQQALGKPVSMISSRWKRQTVL